MTNYAVEHNTNSNHMRDLYDQNQDNIIATF